MVVSEMGYASLGYPVYVLWEECTIVLVWRQCVKRYCLSFDVDECGLMHSVNIKGDTFLYASNYAVFFRPGRQSICSLQETRSYSLAHSYSQKLVQKKCSQKLVPKIGPKNSVKWERRHEEEFITHDSRALKLMDCCPCFLDKQMASKNTVTTLLMDTGF